MIRLQKGPEPDILAANKAAWTRDLLDRLARGEVVPAAIWRLYGDPSVKAQAVADSHGKCIYCESKVRHVSHGDLEHMKPKSRFPEGTYDWTNLGLVCTKCNGAKLDKYDELTPPINPFAEDPDAFLIAVGELVWPRPGNDRATVTEALAKLNRTELVEQRRVRLESIRRLVELHRRASSDEVRRVFADQLQRELEDQTEYAFVSRAAVRALTAA